MSVNEPQLRPLPRTRERLIEAAMEALRAKGLAGVTTLRIARAVGIVQSGVYRHFPTVEALLAVAAERVGARVRQIVLEDRLFGGLVEARQPQPRVAYCANMLALMRREWHFLELLQRFRREPSPLGQVLHQCYRELVDDLTTHLHTVAEVEGVVVSPTKLQRLAEGLLAAVLAVGESEARRDPSGMDAAVELAGMIVGACQGVFHRPLS